MLKLMKYELRKTWFTKAILLAVTAAVEAFFLYGLYGEKEDMAAGGAFILLLLAFGGVLVIGLESVITLHRDMNTKQSYMLFMTPNSCYKILGAKVLECSLSILLTGAFFFALGALDLSLVFAKQGELSLLWDQIREFISNFSVNGRPITIDLPTMATVVFSLLSGWIALITSAYLADVISAALLNGKKMNGVISFVLFLALSLGCSLLTNLITRPIPGNITVMMVHGLLSLVFAAVMYFVTAKIMEDKLSV
jgi:hypothetical protein